MKYKVYSWITIWYLQTYLTANFTFLTILVEIWQVKLKKKWKQKLFDSNVRIWEYNFEKRMSGWSCLEILQSAIRNKN